MAVQNLYNISEEDAIREGVYCGEDAPPDIHTNMGYVERDKLGNIIQWLSPAQYSFKNLWISINGTESWKSNPDVWVYLLNVLKNLKTLYNMEYTKALQIAEHIKELLAPHCERIEIAGSIRRQKPEVGDIEIVVIPLPYETGLFESGIATVVNRWEKVKGELPCRYTQRQLPEGIKLDLFFANRDNWGLIYAIRTGPAEYSKNVLALGWTHAGYEGREGHLYIRDTETMVPVPEEHDLFKLINKPFTDPDIRM